ncbi:phosphonate ABC transporter ATP-binding protein [Enterovibrio norvegicus]|uniref:Phosphonate transport system ATP-binding protein n=2 Tax=Enterovibrio norvegicus TaxID=188144 RepID=A0A1I5VQC4_9GAMM|nr:phosphonate ABC transporter ATP-binding protein [Enterovibrio norvegicus]MCC4796867.1 phosphonate ABC transporter ATP-binding protein [Enterovibrio norvegicus]OEE65113.1 phosphonate ABC transporter ATP-binding protein [Enterovibrio norvegicus]OEF48410.1 phosphonate ABC transporter ATP-binding protein [Enterovibrio norvegicus]OEF57887.1 phosphonate ABC transporter ATP-binding protein [Enterovibrio norvegicus]PMH71584.1 phosphonate ABC transporter ATP-binding protein [Enterovibrio norvegicus]
MDSIIEVNGLTKTFGKNKALDQINLKIQHKEMTALLGPSGSGKSTLLRHLSGLVFSDKTEEGQIQVLGKTVQSQGRASGQVRHCRAQAGYIFQQFNLVNRLSVMTNVLIGALNYTPFWRTLTGNFTNQQKEEAMAALERVGMQDFAHQRVSTLSGGQQQRVAIARALMQKARIIFADEPIASLDPESSRIVMELLSDINRREGIPVIVTLHQVDHALKYCQHVVALRDGKIFYQGESAAIDKQALADLYGSKSEITLEVGMDEQPASVKKAPLSLIS